MKNFLEFHIIQNFVPSNLNRDDTGAPKDAIFGGVRRARISSQCFKRAIREYSQSHNLLPIEAQSVRTSRLPLLITQALPHRNSDEVFAKVQKSLSSLKIKIDEGKTQYLIFLGRSEIAKLANLIDQYWDEIVIQETNSDDKKDKKAKKEAAKDALNKDIKKQLLKIFDGAKAVDVALFGRMLADFPEANQDASCQVAHAISTHRVDRDFDYFTALDDVQTDEDQGAGMIGQLEFNSATFYRYAVLDVNKLRHNLQNDDELVKLAIEAFSQSIIKALPTGKQNSFAAQNMPSFVGVSVRSMPLSLANAFEKPVFPTMGNSLTEESVTRLCSYEKKLSKAYCVDTAWSFLDLTGHWDQELGHACKSLNDLVDWVSSHDKKQ